MDRRLSELVRPLTGGMQDREDFDASVADAIGKDVGRTRHHEFASAVNTAGATDVGLIDQQLRLCLDQQGKMLRRDRAVGGDIREDLIDLGESQTFNPEVMDGECSA